MAGDNVVIMGTLTSGLPAKERRRVIMLGVAMAFVFLIAFALVATRLLRFTGRLLGGGLLLLWVAWNMGRELWPKPDVTADDPDTAAVEGPPRTKSFLQAAINDMLADRWMTLGKLFALAPRQRA